MSYLTVLIIGFCMCVLALLATFKSDSAFWEAVWKVGMLIMVLTILSTAYETFV